MTKAWALPWLVIASTASAAECPVISTTSDVYTAIEDAQRAFTNLQIPEFETASDTAIDALPCLDEPIQRHLSAELHRLVGLRSAVDRDPEKTREAFAAARSLEPEYRFPVEMVPEGSPVLEDYLTVDIEAGRFDTLLEPAEGTVQIDGRPGRERPNSWPAVIQYFDADGKVVWTKYVWPRDSIPTYPLKTVTGPDPFENEPELPEKPPMALGAAAGGTALVAAALFVGAETSRARFANPTTPDSDLDGLRKRTNTMVVGSAATSAIAMGLGVAVLLKW